VTSDAAARQPLSGIPEIAYLFGTRVPIRVGIAVPIAVDPATVRRAAMPCCARSQWTP
jgi:hypothetical protein